MSTLRIFLVMLAIAAVTPSVLVANAAQGKGGKAPGCAKGWFPATGQTTAYTADTLTTQGATVPDDGTVQAGAPLRYTDNGDGTITDNNTGLMWEKNSADGSLHQNVYRPWSRSSLFGTYTIWDWLADLNAEGGTGFAGHNDWRIPNMRELQSIIDFGNPSPAVASVFNTNCVGGITVFTGSCTGSAAYWSSTTVAGYPGGAWMVLFDGGAVTLAGKDSGAFVRAVRGGCVHE